MPNISSSSVSQPVESPDWNLLPLQDKHRICQWLGVADLQSLGRVSKHWRDAADMRLGDLDKAGAAWLQRAESGALRFDLELPQPLAHASDLEAPGFQHLALLRNLQRVRASGLSSLRTYPASSYSYPIDASASPVIHGCVRTASGEPMLVFESQRAGTGEPAIGLCSMQGPLAVPSELDGARLCWNNQIGFFSRSVHGPSTSARPAELVVRCRDGRLAIYCPEDATVHLLPREFQDAADATAPDAVISTNGRHVVAHLGGHLLGYDRETGRVGIERSLARRSGVAFSVDATGVVLSCEKGWGALCPNGRHYLLHDDAGAHLLIRDLRAMGDRGIAMRSRITDDAMYPAAAIGISPGCLFFAVAYGDRTVDLFDLVAARSGTTTAVLLPGCTLELPQHASAYPSLFFSPDGRYLDIAYVAETRDAHYRLQKRAEFLRYALV